MVYSQSPRHAPYIHQIRAFILLLHEVDRRGVNEHAGQSVLHLASRHLPSNVHPILLRQRRGLERASLDGPVELDLLLDLHDVRVEPRRDRRLQHVLVASVRVEHGVIQRVSARQEVDISELLEVLLPRLRLNSQRWDSPTPPSASTRN